MLDTILKRFVLIFIPLLLFTTTLQAQDAEERTTPYTAMRWEEETPYVRVDDVWFELLSIDKVPVGKIVAYAKENYENYWQKRVSEDIVEVLDKMHHDLPAQVSLYMKKDGQFFTSMQKMTATNRRMVWDYNRKSRQQKQEDKVNKKEEVKVVELGELVTVDTAKPYQFKSLHIEYNVLGNRQRLGTETLFIDDYGRTVILLMEHPDAVNNEKYKTYIWRNGHTTIIEHDKKTYHITAKRSDFTLPPLIAFITPEQMAQSGYTQKENEIVSGHECAVYENASKTLTYWIWRGIDLKLIDYSSLGGGQGYTRQATLVEENVNIPQILFEIPGDYKEH